MNEYILGLNFGHDATVVLIKDGEVIEAMMEERFTRVKKYVGFPHEALDYLKQKYAIDKFSHVFVDAKDTGYHIINSKEEVIRYRNNYPDGRRFKKAIISLSSLGSLVYKTKDFLNHANFILQDRKTTVNKFLEREFPGAIITNVPHHLSHAWAAIPFLKDVSKRHLIFTLDGEGDGLCGSINIYEKNDIKVLHEFKHIHSLGLLYGSVVDLLGMTRNEHEFKVMGLAPYAKASSGEKVYKKLRELLWFDAEAMELKSTIDMRRATSYLLSHDFHQHRFDSLAYGIQKLTEELVKEIVKTSIAKYNCADIALGGGVFMNVKANQYLREMPEVKSLVVPPSCGDESIAIGNAVYGYQQLHNKSLVGLKPITNLYLGSSYSNDEIKKAIDEYKFEAPVVTTFFDAKSESTIEKKVAELLAQNQVIGRFKGRAEWGARALGNRSILANPSSRENVKLINEMIKGRDFWMPFATSLLYEKRNDYLVDADAYLAPFMAITFKTKPKAHTDLIAALHPYDLTSRPQMVEQKINPEYHALISHFEKLTGVGGILNTSFNLHGEPNVEQPVDAIRTFMLSGLPYLAIGDYLLQKTSK